MNGSVPYKPYCVKFMFLAFSASEDFAAARCDSRSCARAFPSASLAIRVSLFKRKFQIYGLVGISCYPIFYRVTHQLVFRDWV